MKKLIVVLALLTFTVAFAADSKYWVFFVDKGSSTHTAFMHAAQNSVSRRALERRARQNVPLTMHDVPVCEDYVHQVLNLGAEVIHKSKWLNAISIVAPDSTISRVMLLPCVSRIEKVPTFVAPMPDTTTTYNRITLDSHYGAAAAQADAMGVRALHEAGYRGQGVFVGMLDSGFRTTGACFDSMHARGALIAVWDFVHGDSTVDYAEGDEDRTGYGHGTKTLSIIGANAPGQMVGLAPLATFALGKTENVNTERRTEEDNWIAGVEWLDSLGVDIISSSVGYTTFDAPDMSYTFEQLDGNTARTTWAADFAAFLGITMVNSAGNERDDPWAHINTPADGDSVCAAGATSFDGLVSSFSSPGPTADDRIKPDLCAPGVMVTTWNPSTDVPSSDANGTSFACPLVAGTAAVVLSKLRADGSSIEGWALIELLKTSADAANVPDNDYGYGNPHAGIAASLFDGLFVALTDSTTGEIIAGAQIRAGAAICTTNARGRRTVPLAKTDAHIPIIIEKNGYFAKVLELDHRTNTAHRLDIKMQPVLEQENSWVCYPNPFSDSLVFTWRSSGEDVRYATIGIFDAAGMLIRELGQITYSGYGQAVWNGKNAAGNVCSPGVYIALLSTQTTAGDDTRTEKIKLFKSR